MWRQAGRLAADLFPGEGGDRHVVQVGQIDHLHDRRQVAAEPRQAAPRGHHAHRADQVVRLDAVAEEERQRLVEPRVRRGLGQELRGHVADAVGMAEVVAHEMLDGQQAVGGRRRPWVHSARAAVLGQAKLLRAGEHVAGLARVEVQIVAKPEQEGVGRLDGVVIFLAQARRNRAARRSRPRRSGRSRSSAATADRGACPASA